MNANDFFNLRIKQAKDFGFPDPIFINAEKLTERTRVLYLVEIQAMHIPDKDHKQTHHFSLKFSKFKKTKSEPFWEEEDIASTEGFTISDKASIEKLAAYIQVNRTLLNIDIRSNDYTSVFLTSDQISIDIVKKVLSSGKNKQVLFDLFKEEYPELDKKILTYKLVQARKMALKEFESSLPDPERKERNYWQPFLEKNRWMFGLSYFIMLKDSRIDLQNTPDYLLEAEDGFLDVVEIKHPHHHFWQSQANGTYLKYRNFLQPSEELNGGITQATNYIFQLEKKYNDVDWQQSRSTGTPVKPKCLLVIGRSNTWGREERVAFRLLNDSLHGITIITFDHLYQRASKSLKSLEEET
jgi:hypothetical protein